MIRVLLIFLILSLSELAMANEVVSSIHLNNKGVASLALEDAVAAEQYFIQALAENPFNVIVHLNLGWTFEAQKKYDKAIKESESVLRYSGVPPELKFAASFNAGHAAAQAEMVDVAVEHYQAALDVMPDSMEAKNNIEVLFKSQAGKNKKGDGKGDGKDPSDNKDGEGQGEQPKDQNQDQSEKEQKKEKPKFDSQNLTKEDVRKILEELKAQEQKIRAREYGTKGKEASPEKDW